MEVCCVRNDLDRSAAVVGGVRLAEDALGGVGAVGGDVVGRTVGEEGGEEGGAKGVVPEVGGDVVGGVGEVGDEDIVSPVVEYDVVVVVYVGGLVEVVLDVGGDFASEVGDEKGDVGH